MLRLTPNLHIKKLWQCSSHLYDWNWGNTLYSTTRLKIQAPVLDMPKNGMWTLEHLGLKCNIFFPLGNGVYFPVQMGTCPPVRIARMPHLLTDTEIQIVKCWLWGIWFSLVSISSNLAKWFFGLMGKRSKVHKFLLWLGSVLYFNSSFGEEASRAMLCLSMCIKIVHLKICYNLHDIYSAFNSRSMGPQIIIVRCSRSCTGRLIFGLNS